MTTKLLLPLALLLPLLVGCGTGCEAICEDQKECATSSQISVACEDYCEDLEAYADRTGCQDELDDLTNCKGHSDDICSDIGCGTQATTFDACTSAYCVAHPNDPQYCQ